jgi:enamidase
VPSLRGWPCGDRAQHTAARDLLDSVQLGDIPGIGMVMIDGIVRCGRSRNTPLATEIPVVMVVSH